MSTPKSFLEKAHRTLEAAQLLLDTKHYSDCVSRAYYVMFYGAIAALLDRGITTKTHKGTHTRFNEQFIKDETLPRSLARSLRKSYELRQTVDYDADLDISKAVAENVLSDATSFLDHIDTLLST